MGMAASQARFLQLTARKTNIEYMGQQINQERLALANESAGLFEKQLTMVPPTPPSSLDDSYYTPAYTFTDPVDGVQKKIEITYDATFDTINSFDVTYDKYQPDGSYEEITENSGDNYTLRNLDETWTDGEVSAVADTSGANDTWYINSDLTGATNAGMLDESTGRLMKLVIVKTDASATTVSAENIHTIDLTYSPEFDEVAFDNDMNEYEYEKATYDYEIEKINIETAKIQEQDKSLELKLKKLDTEHNAIQTEMDAVQKVLTKNIESSFKTFS